MPPSLVSSELGSDRIVYPGYPLYFAHCVKTCLKTTSSYLWMIMGNLREYWAIALLCFLCSLPCLQVLCCSISLQDWGRMGRGD